MSNELTEEEMRRALFGNAGTSSPISVVSVAEPRASAVVAPAPNVARKKTSKAFTPRLRVVLRVGNEFEGQTFEFVHEADTLSTLLAEQEATKAARKKFRYVEVVSIRSM